MGCCGNREPSEISLSDPCCAPEPICSSGQSTAKPGPLAWFDEMVPRCHAYATDQQANGCKIVGIMCEYTPREIIMAAGGVPVCLCGGSADMIPVAEETLPATLCPLIKSTFGYSEKKANPFLEMADLLLAETTCDGKKKMYERLADTHAMHVLELPQMPDEADAFEHWVRELVRLRATLEERFDTVISDDALQTAIKTMNRERQLRRDLAALMTAEAPPLTGRELLDLKSLISCIPEDMAAYEKALKELKGRTLTPPAADRVRVLLTGVPLPHGAERVLTLIEEAGGLVVCQENCTGLKPIMDDIDEDTTDPLDAIARKYFHLPCSVMTRNVRRLDMLRDLAAAYRPHCIIEITWQACLTYDIESHYVRECAEKDLGLPYLRIETDYSPSDSARISMRVEALFETVRSHME